MSTDKARENRARRAAARQGLRLIKSRRRDPRAYDYGLYWLEDADNRRLHTPEQGLSLEEIEATLREEGPGY